MRARGGGSVRPMGGGRRRGRGKGGYNHLVERELVAHVGGVEVRERRHVARAAVEERGRLAARALGAEHLGVLQHDEVRACERRQRHARSTHGACNGCGCEGMQNA